MDSAKHIREAREDDFGEIWALIQPIISQGETYPYPRDTTRSEAERLWMHVPHKTFVWEENGKIRATYYLKPNQQGAGNHVCNCGYMVAPAARGKGIARALCEHSQTVARELGYKAMQFNLVVSTNASALKLWQSLGFATVGRLPGAFRHPTQGYVDAIVLYKWLE